MKDAGAELVFLPIYYSNAATILTQSNNIGYAPTFFGCDGMDGILSMENFDTSLAEGLMLLTPFAADATDELTVNFVKKFEEAYKRTPNQFGADEYDAFYAIKAAIEKADLKPDMSVSDICEGLKTARLKVLQVLLHGPQQASRTKSRRLLLSRTAFTYLLRTDRSALPLTENVMHNTFVSKR